MDHLTDAPIANILILAGIIFLAVGIFGRIGGFIGSIFGNIEAGKNSRVLAGVLGLVLVAGGAYLHNDARKSSAATPVVSPVPTPAPIDRSSTQAAPVPPVDKAKPGQLTQASTTKTAPAAISEASPAADREKLPTSSSPSLGDDRLVGSWTNLTPRADSIKRFEIVRDGKGMNLHLWYSCPSGDCDVGYHRLDFSGNTPTYEYNDSNRRRLAHLTLQAPNVLHVRIDLFENEVWYEQKDWVFIKSTTSDRLREALAKYLDAPGEKAFAMATATYSYQAKESTLDSAKEKALRNCEKRAARNCSLVLVNNAAALSPH